jgi:hypothetical protein
MGHAKMRRCLELGLAALVAVLFATTLAGPDWIEKVVGTEPDGGDGSFELLLTILAAVAAIAVILFAGARRHYRGTAGQGGAQ